MVHLTLSDGSSKLIRHAKFTSQFIDARHVDIWLPPGYRALPSARFPVLYMHDGQNLFDPATSYSGVDWGIDEAMQALTSKPGFQPAIVVGIWNSSMRWRDYMPFNPITGESGQAVRAKFIQEQGGPPVSDLYLRFLVEELKPFIDEALRSLPDQAHTFVMGSSMGALISLYALEQYPQVFSGAACLSTHWPAGGTVLVKGLGRALPKAGTHRLYFDYGTATLDVEYEPYQKQMDLYLSSSGFTRGVDWLTLKFEGAEHNELAWRRRVHLPLQFLLGKMKEK